MENISPIVRDSNNGRPLYVAIYDQLYSLIQNGTFKCGEQLPGENILAKRFGVSRSTLRQALLILQEDGIIYNQQGKGNYVANNMSEKGAGLERLSNAARTFNKFAYDKVEIEVSYETPNELFQKVLKVDNSCLSMVFERKYKVKSENACFCITFVPYDYVTAHKLNLNNNNELLTFIDETIYQDAATSQSQIQLTIAGESIARKLKIKEGQVILLIEEVFMLATGEPIAFSKCYFRPDYFDFYVNRRNVK